MEYLTLALLLISLVVGGLNVRSAIIGKRKMKEMERVNRVIRNAYELMRKQSYVNSDGKNACTHKNAIKARNIVIKAGLCAPAGLHCPDCGVMLIDEPPSNSFIKQKKTAAAL